MSSRDGSSDSSGRPFAVGLTGGIGSGKSRVAERLADLGAAIVDTDAIAHMLSAPGGEAIGSIRAAFGDDFIDAAGALDRANMRQLILDDPAARTRLESILHPLIRAHAEAQAAGRADAAYVVFVVPLLVESGGWRQRVDRVLVIDCPVEAQVERVVRTRGLPRPQVEAIVARQATRQARLEAADDVLENAGDIDALAARADRLHASYVVLARSHRACAGRAGSHGPL